MACLLGACQPSKTGDGARDGYSVDGRPVPSIASSRPSYAASPDFKALAIDDQGVAFLSIEQCSPFKAIENALNDCRRRSGQQACRILAIGEADVSGLNDAQFAQIIAQDSRRVAKLKTGDASSTVQIPMVLSGENVPYVRGVARGRLHYNPEFSCVGTVLAQTADGLACEGVWQFRRRVYAAAYPAEGDLDFACSNGSRLAGTYVTLASGLGAARLTDDDGRALFAIYGRDAAAGVGDGRDFLRLWQERTTRAPDATIFDPPPDIQ
jgi:hypothetical protein